MPRGRPRKDVTEVIRIRESDAQKLRQLQLKTGLKSIADAMTLMTQQYVITMRNGHLISRPNTLESVTLEVDLEAATFPDDAGMVPVISGTTDGSTSINIDVDWMRCAQFRI